MGLDMYLNKKTYVQRWDYEAPENLFLVTVTKGGKPFKGILPDRVSYVIEQVAYWRKANAIHDWFVRNVQNNQDDCGEYYVPREKLQELLETCIEVRDNPELAPEKLPTKSGFFFGGTEYDDWYRRDLDFTIRALALVLNEEEGNFFYQSSW